MLVVLRRVLGAPGARTRQTGRQATPLAGWSGLRVGEKEGRGGGQAQNVTH
jgi:hypothetical protein